MAPSKVAKAHADHLLQRGPLENGQPPWLSSAHNRYLEDQLGLARGSMMDYFQSQDTIKVAAREALDKLVASKFRYTHDEHEQERLEQMAEETVPPYDRYPGGLRRRPAVLKPETRTRRRNMPPSVALNDFGEAEWGADVTEELDAVIPEPIPTALRVGVQSTTSRQAVRSGVDSVQDGRVQRQPKQRSPTKQQRSPTTPNAPTRRSSRLRTRMDRESTRGSK